MKKKICRPTIWTMVCACVLGGCGQIGEQSQEMQSLGNAVPLSGVVISDDGTNADGVLPDNGAAPSDTSIPENGGTSGSTSASGSGAASGGVSASSSGTASGGVSASSSGTASGGASASSSGTASGGASASSSGAAPNSASNSGGGMASSGISTSNQSGTTDPTKEEMMKAYQSVLEKLYTDDIFPDGMQYGTGDDTFDKSNNCFAIYDVDFDGKEELIIKYTDTILDSMIEMIYGYDNASGKLTVELSEFPALTFYENGVVKADLSHNHMMGGDFWPYSVYKYDKEADIYAKMGGADDWDKNFSELDSNGNPFPTDLDVNGDGILYCVMGGKYGENTIVDLDEYNQWWDSLVGGAKEMDIPFRKLKEYAQSYAACTSKSVWEVERFARKVKEQILLGDLQGLSKEIAYPITVNGTTYQDEEAFLKADFAGNLNPEILAELEAESCEGMLASGQGIMLGNGCVWIGEPLNHDLTSQGLKVITLNRFTSTDAGK